jgi:hypothetical protein
MGGGEGCRPHTFTPQGQGMLRGSHGSPEAAVRPSVGAPSVGPSFPFPVCFLSSEELNMPKGRSGLCLGSWVVTSKPLECSA